jgi:hypothetical protein
MYTSTSPSSCYPFSVAYILPFVTRFSGIMAVITFAYDKHFGLVDIYQRWLESKLSLCTPKKGICGNEGKALLILNLGTRYM